MGFKEALCDAYKRIGLENDKIVFVTSDVGKSVNSAEFKEVFADRFINVGIAEQNAIGVSAGVAYLGLTPIYSAYAIFASGRGWEIIRNQICYPKLNCKLVATHGGLNVGEDGVTHQATEDIAIMRSLPNMKVFVVEQPSEVYNALCAAISIPGPVYVRIGRADMGTVPSKGTWELGKGELLKEGKDSVIVSVGLMVKHALDAAEQLEREGISCCVVNMRCVKPIDKELLLNLADVTDAFVTAEEHNRIGGLYSAVLEAFSCGGIHAKVIPVALNDEFAESGNGLKVMEKYGLHSKDIINAVKALLKRE